MSNTNRKYMDEQSALARVGGNAGLYNRLLAKFESSIDMADFNESIETSDYAKAGEIVHAAKGVAGNLSLTAFFDASAALMDQLRNGGVPNEEDVALFREIFGETKKAIEDYLGE